MTMGEYIKQLRTEQNMNGHKTNLVKKSVLIVLLFKNGKRGVLKISNVLLLKNYQMYLVFHLVIS